MERERERETGGKGVGKMESNKGTGNFQKRRAVEGIRKSKREVIYTD